MNGVSGRCSTRLGTKIGYADHRVVVCSRDSSCVFSRRAQLGVFRFLLGVGERVNYPAGVKVIGEWFPPKSESLASGISIAVQP